MSLIKKKKVPGIIAHFLHFQHIPGARPQLEHTLLNIKVNELYLCLVCWRGFVAHSSFLHHFNVTTMPPCSINAVPTTAPLLASQAQALYRLQTHKQRRIQLYEQPLKICDKTALLDGEHPKFAWWEMELAKCLSANDIRLSRAFRGRPVLGARMTSSAVAWVVWQ